MPGPAERDAGLGQPDLAAPKAVIGMQGEDIDFQIADLEKRPFGEKRTDVFR
jgi:hypothetical protein